MLKILLWRLFTTHADLSSAFTYKLYIILAYALVKYFDFDLELLQQVSSFYAGLQLRDHVSFTYLILFSDDMRKYHVVSRRKTEWTRDSKVSLIYLKIIQFCGSHVICLTGSEVLAMQFT